VGQYLARSIDPGKPEEAWIELSAADGRLRARMTAGDDAQELDMAFYRDNYAVVLDADGQPGPVRADFVRGPDGRVAWFRFGGRLHARQA
jgi:hypothetical protein